MWNIHGKDVYKTCPFIFYSVLLKLDLQVGRSHCGCVQTPVELQCHGTV